MLLLPKKTKGEIKMGYDQNFYIRHYLKQETVISLEEKIISKYFIDYKGEKHSIYDMPELKYLTEEVGYLKGFTTLDNFFRQKYEFDYPAIVNITYSDLQEFYQKCVCALKEITADNMVKVFGRTLDYYEKDNLTVLTDYIKGFNEFFTKIPKEYQTSEFVYEVS